MEHSSRHLRFKLQSLGRRLDELEEATQNLQKAEDEVLDLQDKIIQAEGSNSSMLADVEALRKRVLKIEGKDEEVKKAEDLCRLIKEKLENEENLTRELRSEIEHLQKQMDELEKLEESFNKSKNDCTQLCLGLNEEKNMSKKLTSELENLRGRVKELELSESKLDEAEQFITTELEKIKCLTVSFVNEKKFFLEKEKQNEKLILDLKQQLELKEEMTTGDQPRNDSNLLQRSSGQNIELCNVRIEDSLNSKSSHTVGFDYIKQSENQTSSKDNDNKNQEDNKIRHLNQEIEKLRNQIKHFEGMEEELKQLKENHCKLQNDYVDEQAKNKQLADEMKALKRQGNLYNNMENGILDTDEITSRVRYKHDRKHKALPFDSPALKNTLPELSPQLSGSERHQPKDFTNSDLKKTSNSSTNIRKSGKYMASETSISIAQKKDDRSPSSKFYGTRDFGAVNETKKSSDHPSVLSRYPPAAQEQTVKKAWKSSTSKPQNVFGEDYSIKAPQTVDNSRREVSANEHVFRETSSSINLDNKVNSNLPEEDLSVENCSLTSMSYSKPGSSDLESVPASDLSTSDVLEDLPKINVNIGDLNLVDTTQQEKSYRNSRYLAKDDVTSYSNAEGSRVSRFNNNEKILASDQDLNPQTSYYSRRRARGKPSLKPQIPEKPHILETSNKELDKRNVLHGLHSRKQISPKEKTTYDRIPNVDHDNQVSQRTFIPETKSVSSDSLETIETQSHPGVRSKTFSPREALQSTVIIKPAIVEKDKKEIMRSYRESSSSDISRPLPSTTQANKVSTSITFYPSEAGSTHVNKDVTLRERHTSTSNIRLSAIDQSVLKNNISIPYEISIRKEEVMLNVANDGDLNRTELNRFTGPSVNRERMKSSDTYDFEAVSWKRHSMLDTNHLDSKQTRRSTLRKGILGSTEELDILNTEKDFWFDTKPRRKSVAEEEKPARLSHEEYPKSKYSILNKTSPELISRRSQSSLSATEVIERRNAPIKKSAAPALWNRYSVEDTDFMNSRIRRYETDKGTTIDSIGRKSSSRHEVLQSQRHMKTTVEDRIRQLEH